MADLSNITDEHLLRSIPHGTLQEAWRSCLRSRVSEYDVKGSVATVAVLILLPQLETKSANITALLTYPIGQPLVSKDIQVTWIYHQ